MAVGDRTPWSGEVVSEVFTDRAGNPVDTPELAAVIEVEVREPDGTITRTYATA